MKHAKKVAAVLALAALVAVSAAACQPGLTPADPPDATTNPRYLR